MGKFSFKLSFLLIVLAAISMVFIQSCSDDEAPQESPLTGRTTVFELIEELESGVSGTITFEERADLSTRITVSLVGASTNAEHPNHIHENSAIESGAIAISLVDVSGATGMGVTEVTMDDEGEIITYDEIVSMDGHIKIHESYDDLLSILASGDIGENVLTGQSESFFLVGESIEGEVKFEERESGSTKATISLLGASQDIDHPAEIQSNSFVEGGSTIISLESVNPVSGVSVSHIEIRNDGTAISYNEILSLDAHVRVSNSSSQLDNIIAYGDLGDNAFTGETQSYEIKDISMSGISGTITFAERLNQTTLATITLSNLEDDGDHPAHIHENSTIEGGSIVIPFNNIVDAISLTNIDSDNQGNPLTYEDLLEYDGHVKIHFSDSDFRVVAEGDIGGNAKTGNFEEYEILPRGGSGFSGTALFEEKVNGKTLVTIELIGAIPGENHPAHIHVNSVLEGGNIVINFNDIDGDTGLSSTSISEQNDGTAISYDELINFDGHLKVHRSLADFSVVAEGDVGGNKLTGESVEYPISEFGGSGVTGSVSFQERVSGATIVTLNLSGTTPGGSHPCHIHENSSAAGGSIIISMSNVDGDTGLSTNQIEAKDNGDPITYSELLEFNGHVRVHQSNSNFSSIASGDIGSNGN